jgi:hypothetical protein
MTPPRKSRAVTRGKPFELGNPGRVRGSRNRVTIAIETLLEGQHEALTKAAIDKALEGDTVALRLCLDRLAPPRRDAPVSFEMPVVRTAADALLASSALLAAVAAGDVTPDEGGRVMALLTAHRSIVETSDHADRIAALEATTKFSVNRRRA